MIAIRQKLTYKKTPFQKMQEMHALFMYDLLFHGQIGIIETKYYLRMVLSRSRTDGFSCGLSEIVKQNR